MTELLFRNRRLSRCWARVRSMGSRRRVLLLVLAAGAVFVGMEVAQHMREQAGRDPRDLVELTPGASLQVKNFHRSRIEDGRKVWEIRGDEATWFEAEERAAVTRPRLAFYREDGGALEARSREGNVFLPGGDLERAVLDGAVDVTWEDARFRSDRLVYLHADDRIVSPGKVRAEVDGVEFEGGSMTYALTGETMELRGGVRTAFQAGRLGGPGAAEGR